MQVSVIHSWCFLRSVNVNPGSHHNLQILCSNVSHASPSTDQEKTPLSSSTYLDDTDAAICSPYLIYYGFNEKDHFCVLDLISKHHRIWTIAELSLFNFLPLLIMLVLYPLIIIKLKQHRVPENVINFQTVIRKKRQNYRLTRMFIVITVEFLLCWGPYIIDRVLLLIDLNLDWCIFIYFSFIARITPAFFHAINPVIYFIFLSSFCQGFKNIFRFSCCSRTRPQAPPDSLNNIPQAKQNIYSTLIFYVKNVLVFGSSALYR